MSDSASFNVWLNETRQQTESQLATRLPIGNHAASPLHEAMRYASLNGGKRLRALLVYATGTALGTEAEKLHAPACAVEFIHAYSLVHDDMPIMDDDDLRRGQPTCHKAYDDATALLVGDALQSLAFESLCDPMLSAEQSRDMVKQLACSSGAAGMALGQAVDLAAVGNTLTLDELETMHRLKTGALINASVQLGALAARNIASSDKQHLQDYAANIGLAFQVQDDVLDVTADTATLGKTQGADIALNKPTYPALLGLEAAQQKANDLIEAAHDALNAIPYDTQQLAALANFVVQRAH